jgi:hypothetical protein
MTKAIARTYSTAGEHQKYLVYALLAACVLFALIYGANLYNVISRTVALQKVEAETKTVDDSVQSLDAKYISLSGNITPEMAKNYGLREAPVTDYINRVTSLSRVAPGVSKL